MEETDKEKPWISRNLGKLLGFIVAFAVTSIYFSHLGRLPISDSNPADWDPLPPLSPQQL